MRFGLWFRYGTNKAAMRCLFALGNLAVKAELIGNPSYSLGSTPSNAGAWLSAGSPASDQMNWP